MPACRFEQKVRMRRAPCLVAKLVLVSAELGENRRDRVEHPARQVCLDVRLEVSVASQPSEALVGSQLIAGGLRRTVERLGMATHRRLETTSAAISRRQAPAVLGDPFPGLAERVS